MRVGFFSFSRVTTLLRGCFKGKPKRTPKTISGTSTQSHVNSPRCYGEEFQAASQASSFQIWASAVFEWRVDGTNSRSWFHMFHHLNPHMVP